MNNRILRINSELQRTISDIIQYELNNPKITGIISVLKVDASSDLEYAKVYISIYSDADKNEVFKEIQHSAGFIRKQLSQKIQLRKVPFLQFYLDNSFDNYQKIENLLSQIKNSSKQENDDENKQQDN